VILIEPSGYRRQPWRNGLGVSEEIAAEHDGAGEWADLVWSVSRTGFAAATAFSDLAGMDRIITLVEGRALALRARDGGDDLPVPPRSPVAFDGGRALDGVPDGPVRVANVMGRRGRVRIAADVVPAGSTRRFSADIVLVHACWGATSLVGHGTLAADWTLRLEGGELEVAPTDSAVLVAGVVRLPA
jgi:environmental stress-induced protein Ves